MAEIQLNCPNCAATYRVQAAAIPAKGRRVECSACLHVWQATPETPVAEPEHLPLPPESFPARGAAQSHAKVTPGTPQLSRPLPENILRILRNEVAFEHRARQGLAAEIEDEGSTFDWPATTISEPGSSAPRQRADPAPIKIDFPPSPIVRHRPDVPTPEPDAPIAAPVSTAAPITPRSTTSRARYLTGFALPVVAACAVLIAEVQPRIEAPSGAWQITVAQLQEITASTRIWFAEQVSAISAEGK